MGLYSFGMQPRKLKSLYSGGAIWGGLAPIHMRSDGTDSRCARDQLGIALFGSCIPNNFIIASRAYFLQIHGNMGNKGRTEQGKRRNLAG